MKNVGKCMKTVLIALAVFLAVFLFYSPKAEARSGCCSSHGGVCGCGCCDGTGLSATCAPYYPSCNSTPTYTAPTYTPPAKTIPAPVTPVETPNYKPPSNSSSSATTNNASVPVVASSTNGSSSKDGNSLGTGIAIGAIGAGGLAWYINKKNKKV